jgi:hypothetical protein
MSDVGCRRFDVRCRVGCQRFDVGCSLDSLRQPRCIERVGAEDEETQRRAMVQGRLEGSVGLGWIGFRLISYSTRLIPCDGLGLRAGMADYDL